MAINLGNINFGIQAIATGFQQAIAQIQNFQRQAVAAAQAVQQAQQAANQAAQAHLNTLQQFARASSLITGPLSGIAYRLTVLGELLNSNTLRLALFVAGIAGSAYAFYRFSEAAIKNEEDLTRVRQMLFALTGSMTLANEEMRNLFNIANKFGVPFDEVAHSFSKIELAARGTQLQGEGVRALFEQIIAYSSNMALTQEQLASILGHVETSLTRNRIQWRELQQVYSRDIPNASELAAKALGKTRAELDIMIRRGDVFSDQLLPKLFQAANKSYGIDSAAPVDNIIAAHNRLRNAVVELQNAFNNALGISDQYWGNLNKLTLGLTFLAQHMREVLIIVGTLGAALLSSIGSGVIIAGVQGLVVNIGRLILAVRALSVAMLAIPGLFFLRLAATIAGAATAYFVLDKALDDNRSKLIGSMGSVEQYLDATEKLHTALSKTTQAYLQQAQAELVASQAGLQAAQDTLRKASEQAGKSGELAAQTWWEKFKGYLASISETEQASNLPLPVNILGDTSALATAQKVVDDFKSKIQAQIDIIERLKKVMADQQKEEASRQRDPLEETPQQRALRLASKELNQFISESNRQFDAMKQGPKALADTLEQIALEKKIEDWRDKMERAGFTAGEIRGKIDDLTTAYTKLRDAQKADKEFLTTMQLIDQTFQDLGSKSVNTFVDALSKGTNMVYAFGQMWKQVLDDIYKKILTLAVVNPILNMLFGGNAQTLTTGTPGSAVGGFFGSLLGPMFGGTGNVNQGISTGPSPDFPYAKVSHAGSGAIRFASFPASLFANAPRLHSGLQPDEYPAILQSGEQVIPRGGSSSGVEVHVHEAPGQPTQQTTSRTPDGRVRLDIMMKAMARDAVNEDIVKGGQTAQLLERRYGLDRTKGLSA